MERIGEGRIRELPEILERAGSQRILFVVDSAAFQASGADVSLGPILERFTVERVDQFEANPKIGDVLAGLRIANQFQPDTVLALGGGTAMDLAKLIARLPPSADEIDDIMEGRTSIDGAGPRLIVIPTTAGTGSEATHFAVLYRDGVKYSIADRSMLPDEFIIDPSLSYSLPRDLTASTGLDALCQAIESIWAVGATDESLAFARRACQLAWTHLVDVVRRPTPESRSAMCTASLWSGKAINISKTTASHALSYRLTSEFGLPHGFAVAITIGRLLKYNVGVTDRDCQDSRGVADVQQRVREVIRLLGATTAEQAADHFNALLCDVGCPTSLDALGVNREDRLEIAQSVNHERLTNNPRSADTEALASLLPLSTAIG